MTADLLADLRRVFDDAYSNASGSAQMCDWRNAGLLAVARYSAERQRGMEATEKMCAHAVIHAKASLPEIFRAMQSAAPLWVDKKGGDRG